MAVIHRLSDFEQAISSRSYLVDRTPYIEKYEQAAQPFVICLRPRGFNKTLLLSMLRVYYEKKLVKLSNRLCKKLYISTHNTPLKGCFSIFYLDFTSISFPKPNSIEPSYLEAINLGIREYLYSNNQVAKITGGENPLVILHNFLASHGSEELFILINEYDCFHHEILDPRVSQFKNENFGKNPLIRNLYAELKQALQTGLTGRIFVVGIDDSLDR